MKIRQKPEDFVVEEIIDLDKTINEDGECYLYKLTKRNIENLKALSYIAKTFKIPLKEIGYCGLKDRHALTTQYITIPKKYGILKLDEKNLKLEYVAPSNPLKIGDLVGNKFGITVRDIKPEDFLKISDNIKALDYGVPNYFDSQRFGSVFDRKFIAKEVILGNYEEALKILLTRYKKSEKKIIKDLKRYIAKNWGDWKSCAKYIEKNNIKSKMFVNIINALNKGKSYKEVFKYVDDRLRKIFVSAYQSYLWNECIKEVLKDYVDEKDRYYLEYECGEFMFYKELDNEAFDKLKDAKFPTIAPDVEYKGEVKEIIDKVLENEGIELKDLENIDCLNCKFLFNERKILCIPKDFKTSGFKPDELNNGKYKITLEFELNKGSYATMIIKRAFLDIKKSSRRKR
jgi:tRNA pseudouridine13 synthase